MMTLRQADGLIDLDLFRELTSLNLGVAQPDNRRAFETIAARGAPLDVHEFPTASEHNGWVVPHEWHVRRATISHRGRILFDGTEHPFAVAGYSSSFEGVVPKSELDRHVFTSPRFPRAYPWHSVYHYRPWVEHWGFCVPHAVYAEWGDGDYAIDLQTEFRDGAMLVAELRHDGDCDETVVFNAHTCHPLQANDDLAGVIVILALFRWLAERGSTRWSYRAVLGPEHLGTVFYLSRLAEADTARLKLCCFVEMVGSNTPLALQRSFTGESILDEVAEHVLRRYEPELTVGDFRTIVGNDETVWEAPGFEIPTISVSRWPYPEYHTSEDNLNIISEARLHEALEALTVIVETLETDGVVERRFTGLVALSNPRYGLYVERPDPIQEKHLTEFDLRLGALQDRLPRYFDGAHTIFRVAARHGVEFEALRDYVRRFEEKELVRLRPLVSLDDYARLPR